RVTMAKLRMQSEVDRFYQKVNRNSFSVLWSEDADLETINQRRFELLTNKRKRIRFCQLAFTPVQHGLSYEPLDSSILAMSRLLFGRVYNTYAPDIDEIEWIKEMTQEFNVTK